MSYTELFYITPRNTVIEFAEFKNSYQSAFLVWSNLWGEYCVDDKEREKRYYKKYPTEDEDFKKVWALFKNTNITPYIRAVLGSTFDKVFLEKKDFQKFYDDVLLYAESFSCGTLIRQAKEILTLSRRNVLGVCWNQTSVNSMWSGRNGRNYKLSPGEVWSLYEKLKEQDGEK